MRLSVYLGRSHAILIAIVWLTLSILVTAISLVESTSKLMALQHGHILGLKLALCAFVQCLFDLLVVAALMGTLAWGAMLSARGETLALSALGVSVIGRIKGALVVALLYASLGAALGEWAVPWALARQKMWQAEGTHTHQASAAFYTPRWHHVDDATLIYVVPKKDENNDAGKGLLEEALLYCLKDSALVAFSRTKLHWADGNFLFASHTEAQGINDHEAQQCRMRWQDVPPDFAKTHGDPKTLAIKGALKLVERRRRAGLSSDAVHIAITQRYAGPIATFIACLLALPWALEPRARARTLSGMLQIGVACVASLLAFNQVLRLLAASHHLPLFMGAWSLVVAAIILASASFVIWCWQRR